MGMLQTANQFFGVAMSASQTYQDAANKKAEAELAASGLDAQAARKDLEADKALEIGRLNQAEQAMLGRRETAELKTTYAASGVKVESGSTLDMAADKAAWNEYERQKVEYEAELESWGLRYDAALLRREAANTRASGSASASAAASKSIVNGVTQLTGLMT